MICPSCLMEFTPTTANPTHTCPGYSMGCPSCNLLRSSLAAAEARVKALEGLADSLAETGEHQQGCRVFTVPLAESPGACDCGWTAAVMAFRAALRPAGEAKP